MDFIVYMSGEKTLLLIPDCFLPSTEAQADYGPLAFQMKIHSSS